jgi:PAS domain S-box-containing protein
VVLDRIQDPDGTLIGFAKITRDLTLRRAAQEELRRSEERFRLLVQSVTDYAIYMLDLDGHVTSWNAGAERFKGYRAEEIIGEHFSRFYPPKIVTQACPNVRSRLRVRKEGSRRKAGDTARMDRASGPASSSIQCGARRVS